MCLFSFPAEEICFNLADMIDDDISALITLVCDAHEAQEELGKRMTKMEERLLKIENVLHDILLRVILNGSSTPTRPAAPAQPEPKKRKHRAGRRHGDARRR